MVKLKSLFDMPLQSNTPSKNKNISKSNNAKILTENNKKSDISSKTNINKSEKSTDNSNWIKSSDKLPEEFCPIEFNTSHKKMVRGYRVNNSIITDTPYFIDKFKKSHGYYEWRYINNCKDCSKCINGFPNCGVCGIKKNRKMI